MNYNDQILENKPFNFFKQLMYNIAVAICIMLVGVLIMVHGFKIGLYEVLTGSEEPYLPTGCMVVVKAQDEYKPGDIIKFDTSATKTWPTAHRLIAIMEDDSTGKTYYICHGDNVQNADSTYSETSDWEDDAEFVQGLINQGKSISEISQIAKNIQTPELKHIEGKVVAHINNYGTYFNFIKNHYMLLIALIAGIWCVSSVVQNEIDIKRTRRLF